MTARDLGPAAAWVVALPALLASACGVAPPPAPAPVAPPPVVEAPRPSLPVHWTLSDQTLDLTLGPLSAAGRLALFRGRRMIVAEGGATRAEVVPAPEPLLQLVLVPTAKGERLVGRTKDGLLRFEDPLGAGSWIAAGLKCDPGFHVGAIPGAVIVWCRGKVPWLLDVETGAPRPSPFPSDFPLVDAAFLNDKDGAAVFTLRGLAVTRDGGGSWSAPKTLGDPMDALYVNTVRVERGRAWAAQSTLGAESRATLDIAGATLGALAQAPFQGVGGPEAEILAPFRQWVDLLRDPLESAAALGVEAPGGGAWVVAGDQVVRVELGTGHASLVARLKGRSAQREKLGRGGRIARSGSDVWILSTERNVVHGTIDGSMLALDEPQILPASASQIRASRSGGVMALGDERDRVSSASVRQPDGSWKRFRPAEPGSIDGAGPLADGRFAFVKDLVATGKGGRPRVARVSPTGTVEEGPVLPLPRRDHLLVASPIEEDAEHVIRFVLKDEEGPLVVVVPADGTPPRVTRVPGATMAGLHDGRGIAVGSGKLFVSLDGGDTWKREATPTRAIAELGAVPEVSDVGARIGGALRIGWGRAEPPAEETPRPAARGFDLGAPRRAAGKRHVLSCRSTGKAASVAAPSSSEDVQRSLGVPADPPEGVQRVVNFGGALAGTAEDDRLESSGMWLEESDTANDGHRPMKWDLRWIDPTEIGSRKRGWRGIPRLPLPRSVDAWSTTLAFFGARADHALFRFAVADIALENPFQNILLARLDGGGPPAFATVPPSELGTVFTGVALGTGPKAPIVWFDGFEVYVWRQGEAPRPIARLPPSVPTLDVMIGEPEGPHVPLLIADEDWSVTRLVPIAPAGKPPLLTADGWVAPAEPLVPERLPACSPGAKGPVFTLRHIDPIRATLDGVKSDEARGTFSVRGSSGGACVARLSLTFGDQETQVFVRADLTGKRAEGGPLGGARAGALACEWIEGPG